MPKNRNLIPISGTGRRAAPSLATDTGAARQASELGQSDVSLGRGLTVDNHHRLSVKQALPVATMAESAIAQDSIEAAATGRESLVQETLDNLIINLRDSGILRK